MICWQVSTVSAAAQTGFQTAAPSVLLMDADSHSVLFEKAADDPEVPASTVKVMTAEVVFHEIAEGRLHLDDQFTVSENAWRTGGALSHGSAMFAALGSSIRVDDLIRGLVIDSGNDAAIVLAEGIAGTEANFVAMMNKRAQELGLNHLFFRNVWGRDDPDQRVTARDMVTLADHVIKIYPDLYKYFGEKDFTWNKIHQTNRNPLLPMDIGVDGLKTGNIDAKSGYGIVASAVQNGQRLILALYGAKNEKERSEESRKILDWGFRSFESRALFQAGDTIGTASVFGGAKGSVDLVSDGPVRILLPRGNDLRLSGKIVYTGPLQAPVEKGVEVAHLNIFRGPNLALDLPLKTAEDVAKGSLPQRAMNAGYEWGVDLFRKYVLKN
ncbi:MAG TPA: D-alanyl-D-alanine carboxypeptidase family protein [Beijerinckiaceae bacterium]|nr:D-alanyl-D-alanine carboxypeptidase family protein [Beijerinckiaceae bacterium]